MWDLIVTMDDATNEHYSMFFVDQEGTISSFQGCLRDHRTLRACSAPSTPTGARHYWHTPEAGGKVDKKNLTQFGRAMHQLGIEMIPAYSPEARGRSERAFRTHQDRLVKELAYHGITTMTAANRYLRRGLPASPSMPSSWNRPGNREPPSSHVLNALDSTTSCVSTIERVVGRNNCVSFGRLTLQIPADPYRCNYVKTKVRVHRYPDTSLAIFHGPRMLARYQSNGDLDDGTKPTGRLSFSPSGQTGQFICFKTGQFYLLPTGDAA